MDLAKYYSSMSGINETSVNAYMAINGQEYSEKRKKPRKLKKKRAASQAAGNSSLQGVESKKNLLTLEEDDQLSGVEMQRQQTDA